MDIKRCLLVVGGIVAALIVVSIFDLFVPSVLAPTRVVDGGSRVIIALAVILVAAMLIASTCRRSNERDERGRDAKTKPASRNKTSR